MVSSDAFFFLTRTEVIYLIGTKHISDLITSPNALKTRRINIIEAPVSSGKTRFALEMLPAWAGNPEKILYLIDTTNGDLSIQRNIIAVSRMIYALCDYNTKHVWGENEAEHKMPVMTYAGFGKEVLNNIGNFHWLCDFDYIVCDEMQNLVKYQNYPNGTKNVEAAEIALRMVAAEGITKIVALSATPQRIREQFKELCYDVPFDRSDIVRLETFAEIPYSGSLQDTLKMVLLQSSNEKKGILYTTTIEDMEECIRYARSIGIRANGFWSIHAKTPMSAEQLALQKHVLDKESIPNDIDLLVINAASETCIKIRGKVDYMIVHDSSDEVKTQVRGRYHGDLPLFYFHDIDAANILKCRNLPQSFMNKRLYAAEQDELCNYLKMRNPKLKNEDGNYYKMRKVKECLEKCGFHVDYKKDSKNGGKHYYVISAGIPL